MFGLLSDTLDALLELQKNVDYASGRDYFGLGTTSTGIYPPVNLFEKEGDLVMLAELPGVKKEDITLEIKSNLLRLAGERKIEYDEEVSFHRRERKNFNFDRTLKLPFNVDGDRIKAEMNDGLLAIALVQKEEDKPRQVAIE